MDEPEIFDAWLNLPYLPGEVVPDPSVVARFKRGNSAYEGGETMADVAAEMDRLVRKARSGDGPTLIELRTYRKLEHCGPYNDNHLNYRPEAEIRYWEERDPVVLLREPLRKAGKLSDVALEEIDREIAEEFEAAVAFAKSSPFPEQYLMYKHVYAA